MFSFRWSLVEIFCLYFSLQTFGNLRFCLEGQKMCGSSVLQQGISAFLSVLKRRLVCLIFFDLGFWFVSVLKLRNGPNGTLQIMFPSAFDFGLECQVTLISDCYYGFCDLTFQNSKIMVLWSFKFINSLNLELTLRLFGCKV
ncbi:hypothetical protein RhiirA5_408888 [Rhizophagus irregularis]|uniref:Uncharacterized protein n=1 Tax=Rhizophagus irregularis TaxID=588596 RepID=A0A2N0Q709_9GLOM|nr:hypothetical protein RhiirA5_408888 [Rhizophagus irregularis]